MNIELFPHNVITMFCNKLMKLFKWCKEYIVIDSRELYCRRREASFYPNSVLDTRIIPYMLQSGFYGVTRLGFISLDWHFITTFIERWRLETYTFHVPQVESTITLQDVSIILGLPIDGVAICGITCLDWREVCAILLGVVLEDGDIYGQRLCLTWLIEHFLSLAPDTDVEFVRCYARAFIL